MNIKTVIRRGRALAARCAAGVLIAAAVVLAAHPASAINGVEGTFEYALDAPWRIEPYIAVPGEDPTYGPLPIVIAIHDAREVKRDFALEPDIELTEESVVDLLSLGNFCSLTVRQEGEATRTYGLSDLAEIESSTGAWSWDPESVTSDPEHRVCRAWAGESCAEMADMSKTSEWHAVLWSAEPVPHNPFDEGAEGPYRKGRPLRMTLGEWFGADGTVTYTCADGSGTMDVDLTGLVPDGVYTMWHFFMAMPPTQPFIGTYDLPVGDREGEQSVFRGDRDGGASFRRVFQPCLQLSGEHLAAGLAVAWHSDGETWGVEPGPFGAKTHVQLYAFLPPRAGL